MPRIRTRPATDLVPGRTREPRRARAALAAGTVAALGAAAALSLSAIRAGAADSDPPQPAPVATAADPAEEPGSGDPFADHHGDADQGEDDDAATGHEG